MRWLLYLTFLFSSFFWEISQAVGTSGNRVLVILEELGEKSKYSKFWGDLTGQQRRLPNLCRLRVHGLISVKIEDINFHLNRREMNNSHCFDMANGLMIMSFSFRQSLKVHTGPPN